VIFSLTATPRKLQESVGEIKINTSDLTYIWRVKMKGIRYYKIERRP